MSRDYRLYLRDMIESAQFIETHTAGLSYEDFVADEVRLRAVLHSLIVLGEAAKHIPDAIRHQAPDVPWREIAGARDIVVHGYFAVNLPIIWSIVEQEIPVLRQKLVSLLNMLNSS